MLHFTFMFEAKFSEENRIIEIRRICTKNMHYQKVAYVYLSIKYPHTNTYAAHRTSASK